MLSRPCILIPVEILFFDFFSAFLSTPTDIYQRVGGVLLKCLFSICRSA
jgi:hypothetical protein